MSLPLLLRVRVLDRALLEGLAPLDGLVLERVDAGAGLAGLPKAGIVAVLEAADGSALGAAPVLGPAVRLGSERALLLELAARAGGPPEAVRWLQLRDPGSAGEVLASPAVAAELEGRGVRIVGGPSPPVFSEAGELLTRL